MVTVPQLVGDVRFWEKSVFRGKPAVFIIWVAFASFEAARYQLDVQTTEL
jgi:hypothetical protein